MKKALSVLLTAALSLGLLVLAPITAHAATIEVANATQLADALNAAGNNTIRLTANIIYDDSIYIDTAKTITLDLNGKTLSVNNCVALYGGAKLLLPNPASGQFNVSCGNYDTITVVVSGAGSKLEVTNVNYTTADGGDAACADWGGEIIVYGNVTSGRNSVAAQFDGSKITINGTLTVPADRPYITVGMTQKNATGYTTPTTKTGYRTYTDGTDTVWVKCNAHTPGDWIVDTQPTATAAGSKHKECTACKYVTDTQTIAATGKFIKLWGKTTTWLDNFGNWLLVIFCFGWIWMAF